MEKYLVRIEFRYSDIPKTEDGYTSKSKKVTIGVYDTFEEACKNGNNLLEVLESKFELHQFPDGTKASKERFSKNGGILGGKKTLVASLAYLKTPFEFYAKIEGGYHCSGCDEIQYDDEMERDNIQKTLRAARRGKSEGWKIYPNWEGMGEPIDEVIAEYEGKCRALGIKI